ncbi:MAG: hypothetical protein ABUL62_07530 [Myxococcales bacterium]
MSFDARRWLQRATWPARAAQIVGLGALGGLMASACQTDRPNRADGTAGARPMDGLERYTRRTVSLETAIDAIEQRDVKKLKMLSVYVRNRDKTALFSEDDLRSLDLAIECLEGGKSQEERSAALDEIKSGKLKKAARQACLEEQE